MTNILNLALRASASLAAIGLYATAALALESKTYSADAFKAAQDAGKPSILHVTAPWCPTCGTQDRVIESLAAKPEFATLTIFKVDFDSQKDVLRQYKASSQSTLIAFKGATESARLVGDTSPKSIALVLSSTLSK